eukprot:1753829-Amphidinium_carterae.1
MLCWASLGQVVQRGEDGLKWAWLHAVPVQRMRMEVVLNANHRPLSNLMTLAYTVDSNRIADDARPPIQEYGMVEADSVYLRGGISIVLAPMTPNLKWQGRVLPNRLKWCVVAKLWGTTSYSGECPLTPPTPLKDLAPVHIHPRPNHRYWAQDSRGP